MHEHLIVFEKLFCQEKSEENYLQMRSGHTDDVSAVPLSLMGAFIQSFTPSSTESWCLQQREQTEKEDPLLVFGISEDIKVLYPNVFFHKVEYN